MHLSYKARRIITVMAAIALAVSAIHNAPSPFNILPGWIFWGVGFIIELIYIAILGRPKGGAVTDYQLLRYDIGME